MPLEPQAGSGAAARARAEGPTGRRSRSTRRRGIASGSVAGFAGHGRLSHEEASTYTRRVREALAVAVDCYAGARGDETPRRFTRGDQLVEILAVVAQWRTPDHRYFTVRTADETYILRQDVTSGGWELTEVGRGDTR